MRVVIQEINVEYVYLMHLSATKFSLSCLELRVNLGQTCKTVLTKDLFINLVFN